MTPLDAARRRTRADLELPEAERIMVERKIKKLPLVDASGTLLGLVTARDLLEAARGCRSRRATSTAGCASAPRSARRGDYLERAAELITRRASTCSSSTSRTATRW